MRVAIVTVSDSVSAGTSSDLSGSLLRSLITLSKQIKLDGVGNFLVSDDRKQISAMFIGLCDEYDVILSTGGTGFSTRDVTPEATLDVIEKRCGGLETALHNRSLLATPMAALSRLCAGIRGSTLIVNVPGSPKAECFEVIEKILPHAVDILHGDEERKESHF